jgi:hypothetical protein
VKTLNSKVEAVVSFTDEMKSQITAAQSAAEAIAPLQAESAESKAKIVALQTALNAATAAVDGLKKQVMSGTVTSSGNGVADAGLTARVVVIEKDVASLKQGGGNTSDVTLLSQSLADLKAKIAAGVSYQDEVGRVKVMVPAADGLDVLQSFSANGLPNAVGLATEVKALALALPKAVETQSGPETGWWGYFSALAGDLITVKSAGQTDWTKVANDCAALAEGGDLSSVVSKLDGAEGALPVELQQWKVRVTSRISQEQALESVAGAVLRQIAAKG